MTVSPISGISSLSGLSGLTTAPATQTSGTGFTSVLNGAMQSVTDTQSTADTLAVKAVTGDLTDIHQATLAATRAQVTMELVSAVRNKGVEAFNEIMRMQA